MKQSFLKIFLVFLFVGGALMAPAHVDITPTQGLVISANQAEALDLDLGCKNNSIFSADCIKEGLVEFFALIWFELTQVITAVVAVVLDFFVLHSISSASYRSGLIEAGWEILRDITNIAFIFALLVIAFKMVLGQNDRDNKSRLMKTILVALVINFSLFFTYTIIDASNILTYTFYNKIETTGEMAYPASQGGGAEAIKDLFTDLNKDDFRSPSLAVISTYNPQKMVTQVTNQGTGTENFFAVFVVIFAAGAINILTIVVFLSVTLLFLGRTVGLIFLGILAPLAFVTLIIPGALNAKYIGFKNWFSQLISLSFMAPVFIFILYLTATFATNEGVLASMQGSIGQDGLLSSILKVVLPFALIAMLLTFGKKIAKNMAGEMGGAIANYAGKAIGGTVALAGAALTGGAALAGGAISGAGSGLQFASKGKYGAGLTRFGNKTMAFKADMTKLPGFKQVAGKDFTKKVSKVTGRSALGRMEDMRKNKDKYNPFANEYDKLNKDFTNDKLKEAEDAEKKAKDKVDNKHASDLYQKRLAAEAAKNDPQYDLLAERIKELNESLKTNADQIKEQEKIVNDPDFSREDLERVINHPMTSQAEKDAAREKIKKHDDAKEKLEELNKERGRMEGEKERTTEGLHQTEKYQTGEALSKLEVTIKTEKTNAADAARKEVARKVEDPVIKNKILDKKSSKKKSMTIDEMEKIVETMKKGGTETTSDDKSNTPPSPNQQNKK